MNEPPYRVAPSYGLEKCPHCGGLTTFIEHEHLRTVCAACGVPVVRGAKVDFEAKRLLRDASFLLAGTRLRSFVYFAVLSALVAIVFAARDVRALVPLLFMGIVLAIVQAVTGASRREKRIASARLALDGAWARAVAALVREKGGSMSARELAETTHISVDDAERILTRLSVDRGRVDIDADQQLHYRVDASEPLYSDATASARRTSE